MDFCPKISKLPKIAKSCNMHLKLKLFFQKTCCLVIVEENLKSLWSNLHLLLLTRNFGSVNSSKASQVCHIMVYGSNYLRNHWQPMQNFSKKQHGKRDDATWIMENMVIIPWSCHESWQPCQETWLPCRHPIFCLTFCSHFFPTWVGLTHFRCKWEYFDMFLTNNHHNLSASTAEKQSKNHSMMNHTLNYIKITWQ